MSDISFSLSDKVALVTGAGKGLGRACALAYAQAGARVIAVARTEADLASLAEEAPAGSIEAWPMDATSDAFFDLAEALDRLDVFLDNVGGNRPAPMLETSDADLEHIVRLNLIAPYKASRSAARVMARAKSGSIIHMSSQMGHVGAANRTVYCMTKHGIEGLTKAMAVELAPLGVRVNAIAPTFVRTPLTEPFLADPAFAREVAAKIPLGRLGKPEDVAAAALYLASDASSLVTGVSLKVDGGWTAL